MSGVIRTRVAASAALRPVGVQHVGQGERRVRLDARQGFEQAGHVLGAFAAGAAPARARRSAAGRCARAAGSHQPAWRSA